MKGKRESQRKGGEPSDCVACLTPVKEELNRKSPRLQASSQKASACLRGDLETTSPS